MVNNCIKSQLVLYFVLQNTRKSHKQTRTWIILMLPDSINKHHQLFISFKVLKAGNFDKGN